MAGRRPKSTFLPTLRRALAGAADPTRAPAMQAYMKSAMPYHGVPVPAVRTICRELFAEASFTDGDSFRDEVLALWHGAEFREERYAAIALTGHRAARSFQTLDALPMYEELIVTGAWWDYVDEVAGHRIGPLLEKHPREMSTTLRTWSRGADLWKRRTSIIAQLFFREATDLALLYDCIAPSLASKEFFLRKAIGWALRQHAKHDPDEVRRYVKEHAAELSPLSRREALKHLGDGE
jgi:3-methyladenine DNA glycosylase AlkD